MGNFSLLAATRSIEASMPFVLYRLMIYLAISLGYLFATLGGAGTLIAFASFSAKPTALANVGAALGFLGFAFLMYKFRGAALFNAKAGTLALLAEQHRGVRLPEGKAQIEFAKKTAAERFTPSRFFELNDALSGALRALPPPACHLLDRVGNGAIRRAAEKATQGLAASCAQAMMSLAFADETGHPWRLARTGLLVHCRHAGQLLQCRGYALAFEIAGVGAGFALMRYPVDAAAALLPVDVGIWQQVFALLFAWALMGAFFSPIATAAMARLYLSLSAAPTDASEAELAELARQYPAVQAICDKAA